MSGDEVLVVDGTAYRFVRSDDGRLRVEHGGGRSGPPALLGTLEAVRGEESFVARRPGGEAVSHPSPWGGLKATRFASRELAVRALLDS